MTTCPACGDPVTPELRFCVGCGTALAVGCPACGAATQPGMRFCGQCGTRLPSAGGPVEAPMARGPGIAAAEVERRLVSVLFGDIVGSTSSAEGRDPEEVREALTRYFEVAEQVIGRYGGMVEKFIGDAVMAVWGTPTAHEDDAERAVRAALDMVDAVHAIELPGGGPEGTRSRMRLRAAVMTGDAAVTLGASGQGMVAGDLVNSASRLQGLAEPGTVLVDDLTKQAADRAIAFESVGERMLRGRTQPLATWRALRVVAERGGQGRAQGVEPPFIGRAEELRILKDQLHATGRDRRARLVTVLGAPGLGKSRLVWEFSKYADGVTEDIFWHVGRSIPYGEGIAYWALGEMVRRRAGIVDSEPEASARMKLSEVVRRFVPEPVEAEWVELNLAVLLGMPGAAPGERDELFAAWRRFFERIAEHGTAVLVFEDLHWADQGLLDFLESLLEWSRSHPILVVGLGRPELMERRPGWGMGGRSAITLHLEAVGGPSMADLVRGTVPGLPPDAIESIAERSEGVPLFAVETIRMLLDEGRLVRDGERFRLVDPNVPFAVPPSLQALIAARLDALDPDERHLLQCASALGRTFPTRALAAVHGADEAAVEAALIVLARKELVVRDTDPRSPERDQYGFVHGMVRDIAYGRLSRHDRATRHLAAARYFEGLDEEELSGVVASHYLDAWRATPEGDQGVVLADRARAALRAAAERAMTLHANAAAVDWFEQALAVTTDPAERASILLRMTEPAEAAQGFVEGMRYLREAVAWYEQHGDVATTDQAVIRLVRAHNAGFDPLGARRLVEPVLERLAAGPPTITAAAAYNEYARSFLFVGEYPQALRALEQGLEVAESLGARVAVAELLVSKSWALAGVGRPREGAALALGGLEIGEQEGATQTVLRARLNASNWYCADAPQRALAVAQAGFDLAMSVGHGDWAATLAGNAGAAAIATGDWHRILGYREALSGTALSPAGRFAADGMAWVVDAYRGDDPTDTLSRITGSGLGDAVAVQERGGIYAIAAQVRFAGGDLEAVEEPALRAYQEYPEFEGVAAVLLATRAAVLRRDLEPIRRIGEIIRPSDVIGSWLAIRWDLHLAASQWLEGESTEGEQRYREAIQALRQMGLVAEVAFTQLELLALGGDELRDRGALRAEAVGTLEALGVRPLLERLGPLIARGAPVDDRQAVVASRATEG
ncbi:MAG: adenylate/guanylate cyclase domain-containing protein [Candidatus Limnocylindrales bacterium]